MYSVYGILAANLLKSFIDFIIFMAIFWCINFYISVVVGNFSHSAGLCPVSCCGAADSVTSPVDFNILP